MSQHAALSRNRGSAPSTVHHPMPPAGAVPTSASPGQQATIPGQQPTFPGLPPAPYVVGSAPSNAAPVPPQPNGFTKIRELGSGIGGTVHLVERNTSGERLACKSIPKNGPVGDPNYEERLQRELAILNNSALNPSPLLCSSIQTEETDRLFEVYMPYYGGGDLCSLVERNLRAKGDGHVSPRGMDSLLSNEKVQFLAAEVLAAIEGLHQEDIVHRDIKAENVMLTNAGHIVLADFGFARTDLVNGRPTTPCGSPDYVAPEVWCGQAYDRRCDIWSYGVLLYVMAFGRVPFYEPNMNRMVKRILDADYAIPARAPQALQNLLDQIFQVDPDSRATIADIKASAYFAGIDWDQVKQAALPVPP